MAMRIRATLTTQEWIKVRKLALDAGINAEDYVAELIRFALNAGEALRINSNSD